MTPPDTTQVALDLTELTGTVRTLAQQIGGIVDDIGEIKAGVKHTNGDVTDLKEWRIAHEAASKAVDEERARVAKSQAGTTGRRFTRWQTIAAYLGVLVAVVAISGTIIGDLIDARAENHATTIVVSSTHSK